MATPIDGIGAGYTTYQSFNPVTDQNQERVRPRQGAEQLVDRDVVRRKSSTTDSDLQDKPATDPDPGVRLEGNLARLAESKDDSRLDDENSQRESETYSPASIRERGF